jgi:hypothetical protein
MTERERKANEKAEARAKLLELLKPGDEVKTILRHRSRSGMMRSISVIIKGEDYTWAAARALGDSFNEKTGGIRVSGCGMDMGFNLVYNLSRTLYPDGFTCTGIEFSKGDKNRCPSNDHSNGDRNYKPHMHSDGGYALRQAWL